MSTELDIYAGELKCQIDLVASAPAQVVHDDPGGRPALTPVEGLALTMVDGFDEDQRACGQVAPAARFKEFWKQRAHVEERERVDCVLRIRLAYAVWAVVTRTTAGVMRRAVRTGAGCCRGEGSMNR